MFARTTKGRYLVLSKILQIRIGPLIHIYLTVSRRFYAFVSNQFSFVRP